MQIESNQSKLSPGWLPLCIHCKFENNILFWIFLSLALVSHHMLSLFHVEFMLFCFLFSSAKRRGEISFPLEWIDRFVRRKRWIISAVAKGCREVDWHRHWLSLLRSEGIVRLSWGRKRAKRRGACRLKKELANWMRCKCPVGVSNVFTVELSVQVGLTIGLGCFYFRPLGERKRVWADLGSTKESLIVCGKCWCLTWSLFRDQAKSEDCGSHTETCNEEALNGTFWHADRLMLIAQWFICLKNRTLSFRTTF